MAYSNCKKVIHLRELIVKSIVNTKWKGKISALYSFWVNCLTFFQDVFLLLVRLYWGYNFFQAGLGKFNNFERTVGFFESINIPFAVLNAYLASGVELVGGLLLMFGLLSRIITVPLIFTMIIALITTEKEALSALFLDPNQFTSTSPFLYLFASVIVLLFGAGRFSLDYLLSKILSKKYVK
jgi:putative oxidoreductase